MIGTWINVGAIVVGGVVGRGLGWDVPGRWQRAAGALLGVLALVLGLRMVWVGLGGGMGRVLAQLGLAIVALMVGHAVGRGLGLQRRLNRLGKYARERYEAAGRSSGGSWGSAWVASSILFGTGPLGVVGALQEGWAGDARLLVLKAALDGMAAMGLARALGWGVVAAAVPVLAYQGTWTLLGAWMAVEGWGGPWVLGFSTTAGMLVALVSLLMLDVWKVRWADYLPALVLGPVIRWLALG